MRALRVVLALLLSSGSVQAQPVVDLLTRYAVPADQTASSAPEGDAPPGSGKKLAELEAYLALVSEALEAFAHPQDAEKALRAAKPRLPDGTAPFFRDRATALDTLYRTLAVVDYTWALRFPDPPCSPAAKRARLLRSDDGLFLDPISGKTSPWMAALLGPNARDKSLEASLDQASISAAPSQAEYARLRARQNLITKALDSEDAVGEARAKLYCTRAEVREKLASSNRASGPVLAARSSGEGNSRKGLVIMAGRTADDLEIRGAGVVVETKSGIRILTDRRLGAGTVVALVDRNPQPVPLSIERDDEKSGLMLLRPDGDVGEAMTIGEAAPKKDDLVFAFAHSDRLGAWTRTQGLVTSADAGQFQTDAVADASMTGGAILDEAGVLAGILVLRRAGDGGGEWPAAVPAPALRVWIDGGDAPEASPAPISDAGTTKILTASRPLLESVAVGQGAISASADSFTQRTPWGSTTRAVCVANCGDSSSGSSYSGGGNANAELGQALGKLAAIGVQALIFKGIPALFRGIGSLFKAKPLANTYHPPPTAPATAPVEQERPPEPPTIQCTLKAVDVPNHIGAEMIELRVRLECPGADAAEIAGQAVSFSLGWDTLDGSAKTKHETAPAVKATAITDADGYASLAFYINNEQTRAERSFDDLDRYDPEKRALTQPPGHLPSGDSKIQNASRVQALIEAGDSKSEPSVKANDREQKASRETALALTGSGPAVMVVAGFAGRRLGGRLGGLLVGTLLTIGIQWQVGGNERVERKTDDGKSRLPVLPKPDPFRELANEGNRGCLPATPANIKAVVRKSSLQTLQLRVSAPGVQTYVDLIAGGAVPPPIKVSGNIIVDGNHRYIAGLLCAIEVPRTPYPAPHSAKTYPVADIEVDEIDWRE